LNDVNEILMDLEGSVVIYHIQAMFCSITPLDNEPPLPDDTTHGHLCHISQKTFAMGVFVIQAPAEYLPVSQLVHTGAPAVAYVPAAHAAHTPFTMTYPAEHCAEAREIHANRSNARTSRMPHTPRAFISRI